MELKIQNEIPKETENSIVELEGRYMNYKISTNEQYVNSAEDLKGIKSKMTELDTMRKKITKPLDDAKKEVMNLFNNPLKKLESLEVIIKSEIISYQKKLEQIRIEEQRKADEKARKEEEAKRKKIQEQIEKAKEQGNIEKVEKLEDKKENIEVVAPTITIEAPKISGISKKTIWKFKVVDAEKIPRQYLIPNETMLQKLATATKGIVKIDGIEFYSEDIISSRS